MLKQQRINFRHQTFPTHLSVNIFLLWSTSNILNCQSYLIKFILEQAMKVHWGIRGARCGWVINATPRCFIPRNDPVPIVQEAGWATGSTWTGAEYFSLSEIRTPNRPDRSDSLYRLSYPGLTAYLITNMNVSIVPLLRICTHILLCLWTKLNLLVWGTK